MSDTERPMTDMEALTAVLAEWARESAGPDPEAEELLDYLEGRLSAEADREMERRLVASPSATRKLLDLAAIAEAGAAAEAAGAQEPADLAVHAGWRDLQARLPRRSAGAERPRRLQAGLLALAATLLLAVLALGTWVWQLERGSASGSGTGDGLMMANLETLELFGAVRSDRLPAVTVEPGEPFRIALHPEDRCPTYRAEIVGPAADERRVVPGLERDELGLLTLLFRGRPGTYTLRLLGCEPEQELSTYGFEIVSPGVPPPG